ncbi:MAG: hypothetical protein AAFR96_06800 [Planctomycetota bacterium]
MSDESTKQHAQHDPSLPFRLTADDLLGDLAWPKLLHAPRLAFRSGRIGLGIAAALVIALVDQVLARIAGGEPIIGGLLSALAGTVSASVRAAADLNTGAALLGLLAGIGGAARDAWSDAPVRSSVLVPLAVVWQAFVSVAVGRLAAEEFARGSAGSWIDGLRWSVARLSGIVIAYALPTLVVGLLIGVLAVGGWALLSVPFANVLGAVLGIVGLLLSLALVAVVLGMVFGSPLFAAAIAVEGSDGIDAVHRSYAYVFARPLRAALYAALLVVQGIVVVSVLAAIAALTVGLFSWATGLMLNERASLVASGVASDELGPGGVAAAGIMRTVLQLPAIVLAGYAVSYWASGSAMLYIALRRIVDGQDMVDLYVPGEIEERIDAVLASRDEAITQAAEDRPA